MKKLYTTLATLTLLCSVAVAQQAKLPVLPRPVNTAKAKLNPGLRINESRSPIINPTQEESSARGGLVCGFTEDFENGLPGTWTNITINPNENWRHEAAGGNPDGYMVIDYDGGPGGTNPGVQNESLWTPAIDLTAIPNPTFKFDWSMSYFWSIEEDNYDLKVEISTDGLSWTTVWEEGDFGVFETFEWYTTNVDLSAYSNLSGAIFRFNYAGQDGAYASIDNISVCVAQNDLRLKTVLAGDIISDYAYSQVPVSQASQVIGGAIFENVGGTELTDISIESETVSFVVGGNVSMGTLAGPTTLSPGESDTVWVATGYTPSMIDTIGQIFSVTANEADVTPDDNIDAAILLMTADTWAHDYETEDYFALGYESSEAIASQGFEMGSSYFCQTDGSTIYAAEFALGSATTATVLVVNIYENSLLDGPVSSTIYDLMAGDLSTTTVNFITVNLDDPVPMIAGNTYIATISIEGGDDAFILGNLIDDGDFAQLLYSESDDAWYNWPGLTTSMRLRVSSVVGVEENEGLSSFDVYPNPTTDNINVAFTTDESEDVSVNLFSSNGQLIQSVSRTAIAGQVNNVVVNGAQLPRGVYNVQILGNSTSSVKRILVQ